MFTVKIILGVSMDECFSRKALKLSSTFRNITRFFLVILLCYFTLAANKPHNLAFLNSAPHFFMHTLMHLSPTLQNMCAPCNFPLPLPLAQKHQACSVQHNFYQDRLGYMWTDGRA